MLALGKAVVIATVYYYLPPQIAISPLLPGLEGWLEVLRTLSYGWDGMLYQFIAGLGYPSHGLSQLDAFSPFYPALIRSVYAITGSYWESSLIVTNAFSFIFPVILLKLFDLRTAILAEMFPTYLVYTTVGYSDALALVFLSLAILFFLKKRLLLSGVALSLAGLVLYDLLIAGAAFLVYMLFFQKNRSFGSYLRLLAPLAVTGASILAAYQIFTGNALTFLDLEKIFWGVVPTSPVGQIEWLMSGIQIGSFAGTDWNILGIQFTSTYWIVRNVLFEAFFFFGIYLLARTSNPDKWLFVLYSLTLTIPLLFVEGTPVYSIPRLILAAFPVFLGYSQKVFTRKWWSIGVYVVIATLVSCFVVLAYVYAFFA